MVKEKPTGSGVGKKWCGYVPAVTWMYTVITTGYCTPLMRVCPIKSAKGRKPHSRR